MLGARLVVGFCCLALLFAPAALGVQARVQPL